MITPLPLLLFRLNACQESAHNGRLHRQLDFPSVVNRGCLNEPYFKHMARREP